MRGAHAERRADATAGDGTKLCASSGTLAHALRRTAHDPKSGRETSGRNGHHTKLRTNGL